MQLCLGTRVNVHSQQTVAAADLRDEYLKGRGTPGQGGVDIGAVGLRLSVTPLQGMQRDRGTGSTSKVFLLAYLRT